MLNLASEEYSKAAESRLPQTVQFITCTFGEWKNGKIIEKGTMCKMARSQMVRWLRKTTSQSGRISEHLTSWATAFRRSYP